MIVLEDFRNACADVLADLGYHHVAKVGSRDDVYLTEEWRKKWHHMHGNFGNVAVP